MFPPFFIGIIYKRPNGRYFIFCCSKRLKQTRTCLSLSQRCLNMYAPFGFHRPPRPAGSHLVPISSCTVPSLFPKCECGSPQRHPRKPKRNLHCYRPLSPHGLGSIIELLFEKSQGQFTTFSKSLLTPFFAALHRRKTKRPAQSGQARL